MSAQAIPIHEAPAGEAPDRKLSKARLRGDVEKILAVAARLWLAGVAMDGVPDFATAALAGYGADSLWSKGIDKFTQKAAAAVANQ